MAFRAVPALVLAVLTLLAGSRFAFASSPGIQNAWGFNSPTGCMSSGCHTNGAGTPAAIETSFNPGGLAVVLGTTTKLTITVNVGSAQGAGINVSAWSLAGGAPAGTLSTCNTADPNCAALKTIGAPAQITHTMRHAKDAGNLVTFAFNYTAPAGTGSGCFADKLEIWINAYNNNGNSTGEQAIRLDHVISSSGLECADDGNPCTTEVCNAAAVCVHDPGNAGATCRAAAGLCDVDEVCDGVSATCPANGFAAAGTTCRASAGLCDVAESCTGSSAACPPDGLVAAGTTCRPSADVCDTAEVCTGSSAACPDDALKPAGTLCRPSADLCDVAETCTGSSTACPDDGFVIAGTPCRPAVGLCDVAEVCTGSSASCPVDGFVAAGVTCRAAVDTCDVAEACTGSAAACPPDGIAPVGTPCRPPADACDAAEACTGASTACPPDDLLPAGTVCRAAAGACDAPESCTGSSAACPADARIAAGTVCRPSAGPCDPDAESCDGSSADCPPDVLAPSGTQCSGPRCSDGDQTLPSSCTGKDASCPTPIVRPCDGYACDGAACLESCKTSADCLPGFDCDAGACTPPLDLGRACDTAADCASGFCVDGVCCDRACSGQCEACNQGKPGDGLGTCRPVTGAPVGVRAACADDGSGCGGTCDGVLTMACAYPGAATSCRAASCASGAGTLAASCNGAGACPAIQTQACAPYACSGAHCAGDCLAHGDADCALAEYCAAGVCVPRKALGASCSAANQCASAHCADGVCCDTACGGQCEACAIPGSAGTCSPVIGAPVGGRPACAADGTACDGACDGIQRAICAYPGSSTVCRPGTCAAGVAVVQAACNGSGTCPALATLACAPYACDDTGVACAGTCAVEADCQPSAFCAAGMCLAKQSNGAACGGDGACASGHCVDGRCCDTSCTGQCGACDVPGKEGTCSPMLGAPKGNKAPCATDGSLCGGACDGVTIAGCAYPGSAVACRPGSCEGDTATLAASCDGHGACPEVMTQICGASGCGPTMCIGDCTGDADCAAGAFCSAGVCTPAMPGGSACGAAAQCSSGFCVDGFCCDGACNGQCEACNVAGAEGACTPVVGGPHGGRPACGGSGTCAGACDGKRADACTFPGAELPCGEATCGDGFAIAAPVCNGDGTCGAGERTRCATCEGNACAASPVCPEGSEGCETRASCACDLSAGRRPDLGALGVLALGVLARLRRRRGAWPRAEDGRMEGAATTWMEARASMEAAGGRVPPSREPGDRRRTP